MDILSTLFHCFSSGEVLNEKEAELLISHFSCRVIQVSRSPFLWPALLQCIVKTYIKQGANKRNYGRLVGKRSGEKETGSVDAVVSLHIRLALRSCWRNAFRPQLFMGVIMMHSTQGMFNCGIFFADNKLCYCLQLGFVAYLRLPPSLSSNLSALCFYVFLCIYFIEDIDTDLREGTCVNRLHI